MKQLILLFSGILFAGGLYSQSNNEFYNNGSVVKITAGAEVHVLGDVHMRGATGTLENDGLLKLDGNLYGDNLFQQRGTGTVRMQNNLVNIGQTKKISGSYAVRGSSSANKGVNDGSFYILELGNDQGIVWLETNPIAGSTQYVADVRQGVDFQYGGVQNRIITMNPASVMTGVTDGPDYTAVFGIINPAAVLGMGWAQGGMADNTVLINGSMSGIDAGYVQGKLRREIDPAGGSYPFVLGLEPNVAGAQRGMQYARIDFAANTYDVIEGYFDTGMDNTIPGLNLDCNGYEIDYFGGVDHGQWVYNNPAAGSGSYTMNVWPQDDNFPTKDYWLITKDNTIDGTLNECGPTPVGLLRSGFNGFSTFGVAATSSYWLPAGLIQIWAESKTDYIQVNWQVATEHNLSHYVLERSTDGNTFSAITVVDASGNSTVELSYSYDDLQVQREQDYYYRYRSVDFDGTEEFSPIVQGRLSTVSDFFVELYPNPALNDITIYIESEKERQLEISLYNSLGQLIANKNVLVHEGNNGIPVDLMQLSDGVYTFRIEDISNGSIISKRFIKN